MSQLFFKYDLIVWLKKIEEDEIVDSRRCVDQLIKSQLLAKVKVWLLTFWSTSTLKSQESRKVMWDYQVWSSRIKKVKKRFKKSKIGILKYFLSTNLHDLLSNFTRQFWAIYKSIWDAWWLIIESAFDTTCWWKMWDQKVSWSGRNQSVKSSSHYSWNSQTLRNISKSFDLTKYLNLWPICDQSRQSFFILDGCA